MRFLSFVRNGKPSFGALVEGGVADLSMSTGCSSLRQAIEQGQLPPTADGLFPHYSLSDVTLLPVIPDPQKILCIGLNYETHRAETRRPDAKYPTVFTRYADSQVAHGQPILRPRVSAQLDYEGELAVVIGRGGRNISVETALRHVAGYACYNDATIRDWQRHTHQFTPGKTFPGTGAFGPVMVTAGAVPDYRQLRVRTVLNGQTMQDGALSDLIFSLPDLIAYCSAFTPLSAGDVILTGTPGGVGDRRDPPLYMKDGDVVEVVIEGVGHLVNRIADEP